MDNYPKVLLVSHNALSKTNNNGKTIETFFSQWPKEKLAHLYFSPEYEDQDFCNRSFAVHDYDALDNFLRVIKRDNYKIIHDTSPEEMDDKHYFRPIQKMFNQNRKKIKRNNITQALHTGAVERNPLIGLAREVMWLPKGWAMKAIYQWIEEFQPEVLFFQGSGSVFSYKIVDLIRKKYKLPVVLECTDDYTKPLYPDSWINRFLVARYLRLFRSVISESKAVYTISDKMQKEYQSLYGGKTYYTLSNSVTRDIAPKEPASDHIRFLYAGNLGLNRWVQLCNLGAALDLIREREKLDIRLDVYSGTALSEEMEKAFVQCGSFHFCGFVSGDRLNTLVAESDYLVHAESFDEKNKRVTRLSISTKIGEYMASNRCIVAIGPDDVASIEYIKENRLGLAISSADPEEIAQKLMGAISDPDVYRGYVQRSYQEYSNRYTQEIIDHIVKKSITGK